MSILNRTVQSIIAQKPRVTIPSSKTVLDAVRLMEEYGTRALGVTVGDYFVGLFTRGDMARRVRLENRSPGETVLAEVITMDAFTITRDCTFRDAYFYMCKYGFSHLPVVEKNKFYGIVSEEDLRQQISSDLKQMTAENNMLMSYIKGESYGVCAVNEGDEAASR